MRTNFSMPGTKMHSDEFNRSASWPACSLCRLHSSNRRKYRSPTSISSFAKKRETTLATAEEGQDTPMGKLQTLSLRFALHCLHTIPLRIWMQKFAYYSKLSLPLSLSPFLLTRSHARNSRTEMKNENDSFDHICD